MTSALTCALPDRPAAVVPVAGLRAGRPDPTDDSTPDPASCRPAKPVPVLAVHGQQDPINPYDAPATPPGATPYRPPSPAGPNPTDADPTRPPPRRPNTSPRPLTAGATAAPTPSSTPSPTAATPGPAPRTNSTASAPPPTRSTPTRRSGSSSAATTADPASMARQLGQQAVGQRASGRCSAGQGPEAPERRLGTARSRCEKASSRYVAHLGGRVERWEHGLGEHAPVVRRVDDAE